MLHDTFCEGYCGSLELRGGPCITKTKLHLHLTHKVELVPHLDWILTGLSPTLFVVSQGTVTERKVSGYIRVLPLLLYCR